MTAQTITIDNKEYPIDQFSSQVQELVSLRTTWQNEARIQKIDLIKTESAIAHLDRELAELVEKELTKI